MAQSEPKQPGAVLRRAYEPNTAVDVRERARSLRERAAASSDDPHRVIAALVQVAARLADPRDALAHELRQALQASTGLSPEMVEWGLSTTLASMQGPTLERLAAARGSAKPLTLIAVVLAGNVFVATLRALALPLLAGGHVLAKAASGDIALAHAFKRALDDADATTGQRLEVIQFARSDRGASQALCVQADALSVYGDDETVQRLANQLRPGTRLIAHGHGLSAAYVHREAVRDLASARGTARQIALDVAAYDQHGCLSPHFVLVDAGAAVPADAFARILADEALPELAQRLPPGPALAIPSAATLQWRAVASVRGESYAHATHTVSFEADQAPRPSPGGRLVAVHSCSDLSPLQPFGAQLKCLGVAASESTRAQIARELAAISSGYVCPSGEMQTPPFDAYADGRPPLAGLSAAG